MADQLPKINSVPVTATGKPINITALQPSSPTPPQSTALSTSPSALDTSIGNQDDDPAITPGDIDTSWQAWTIVLGSWCAMIPSMGLLNTLAVLEAWLTENELQNVPKSTAGWIFSSYAFFLYFCGAQVGPIFDAHDVRLLIVPGSIGMVASLIFLSFSTEFYQFFLSFGVLGGISASLLFNPSLAAISQWFLHKRAFATGLACTAGGLGGVAFPLIILQLSPRIGFPWAIRIVALLSAVHLSVACLLLRKRLSPNRKSGAGVDLKALREKKYAITTLGVFLVEFAVFIPYTYICSYAIYAGMSHRDAYMLNVFLNVGAVPGRVIPGYVADRLGVFNTMVITSLACTAFILGLWQTSFENPTRITVFTVLFGFFSGAAISLTPVCIAQVCHVEDIGKRTGTAFFVASFGALVGVPIAASVLEGSGSYVGLICFGGAFYLAAVVVFAIARGVAGGWKLSVF